MIIKSIKLNNIRSYTSQEIKFPESSTLLSGDIGSGKSSILLALEFALFGIKRKQLSGSALLRHGAREGSVEVKLKIKDKDIIIKRVLKRTNNDVKQEAGYIVINDNKYEATPVELKSKIFEILGYPQDLVSKSEDMLYRYTVYTPQESMKEILYEAKDKRLETLRKIFDIEKYKRTRDNTAIITREIKKKKSFLEGEVLDLEEKKRKHLEQSNEIEAVKKEFSQFRQSLDKKKSEIAARKKELEDAEKKQKKLAELKKDAEILGEKLSTLLSQKKKSESQAVLINQQKDVLKNSIKELPMKKPTELSYSEVEKAIAEDEKKYNEFQQIRLVVEQKEDNFAKYIKEYEKEIKNKKEKLQQREAIKNELDKIKEELKEKEAINKEMDEIKHALEHLLLGMKEKETLIANADEIKNKIASLDKCPTCLQEIKGNYKSTVTASEDKKINNFKKILDKLKEQKEKDFSRLNKLKEKLSVISEKEKLIESLKTKIQVFENMESELKETEAKLCEAKKQQQDIAGKKSEMERTNIAELRKRIENNKELLKKVRLHMEAVKEKEYFTKLMDEKEKLLAALREEKAIIEESIQETEKNKAEISKEITAMAGAEEIYRNIKQNIETLFSEERMIEIRHAELSKEISSITKTLAELHQEIERKNKIKSEIQSCTECINWLEDYFVNLMHTLEKHIMARIYMEFNELFVNWFSLLVDDERLSVRLDDEFTPEAEQNGYEAAVESLSGGERTAIALAYRLALNKVINDLMSSINTKDIIILDEPTDGFSSEQLDKVREVLEQLNIKQTIIVSHESKIESFVDNVIRINKMNHESTISS